jgi:hypothetical protein
MSFLPRFLVALAITSVAYATPLRAVNPEGDFSNGVFAPIVVDAREFKMAQLRGDPAAVRYDALVLGSSRSMQIGPELDARYGTHSYNFAVDSAHAEDYLAIYHWVKRLGLRPRLLAIGVDLEALHDSDKVDERYERNVELVGALGDRSALQRDLDAAVTELQKYKRMFTAWYAADAARSLRVHLSTELPPQIEALGSDGLLSYPRWEAQRRAGTFDLRTEVASCLPLYVDRFRDMRGLSSWRSGLLAQLFSEAAADGAVVVAWLTPLRPETIELLGATTEYPRVRAQASSFLADLASRNGARWRDLSDPTSFGATADGWYDCAHLDATNLTRLIAFLPK